MRQQRNCQAILGCVIFRQPGHEVIYRRLPFHDGRGSYNLVVSSTDIDGPVNSVGRAHGIELWCIRNTVPFESITRAVVQGALLLQHGCIGTNNFVVGFKLLEELVKSGTIIIVPHTSTKVILVDAFSKCLRIVAFGDIMAKMKE